MHAASGGRTLREAEAERVPGARCAAETGGRSRSRPASRRPCPNRCGPDGPPVPGSRASPADRAGFGTERFRAQGPGGTAPRAGGRGRRAAGRPGEARPQGRSGEREAFAPTAARPRKGEGGAGGPMQEDRGADAVPGALRPPLRPGPEIFLLTAAPRWRQSGRRRAEFADPPGSEPSPKPGFKGGTS